MVACAPKSSLHLDATLSEGESRRDFGNELAAAFEVEETLADARLFPPLEACMPEVVEAKQQRLEGVDWEMH